MLKIRFPQLFILALFVFAGFACSTNTATARSSQPAKSETGVLLAEKATSRKVTNTAKSGGDKIDCFAFQYPLTVTTSSGRKTVKNDKELDAIFGTFDDNEPADFVYPFNVILEDGKVQAVANEAALDALFDSCYGATDASENYCFEFVYPMTVSTPKGNVDVSDEESFFSVIDQYAGDELDTDDVKMVFPIQVRLANGSVRKVNSESEIDKILEDCE